MDPETEVEDYRLMSEALVEARAGREEGGVPIGSVLAIDGEIVGRGHNRRVQEGNPILHGEMDCLRDAGRLPARDYQHATLYTTLSPCDMCSGAILLFGIPRVVTAENQTFVGAEELLRSRGVELVNLDMAEAKELMAAFIREHPEIWNEDIGSD
jgi:cytosine deaminase